MDDSLMDTSTDDNPTVDSEGNVEMEDRVEDTPDGDSDGGGGGDPDEPYLPSLNEDNLPHFDEHSCGEMSACPHCGGMVFDSEKTGVNDQGETVPCFCCSLGKKKIHFQPELCTRETMNDPKHRDKPNEVKEAEIELAAVYRAEGLSGKSRKLNYLFCFSSQLTDPSKKKKSGEGMYTMIAPSNVQMHGRTYHMLFNGLNSKKPGKDKDGDSYPVSRMNGGVYWFLHDPNFLNHSILHEDRKLCGWFFKVMKSLEELNPFVKTFKTMHTLLCEEREKVKVNSGVDVSTEKVLNDNYSEFTIHFDEETMPDQTTGEMKVSHRVRHEFQRRNAFETERKSQLGAVFRDGGPDGKTPDRYAVSFPINPDDKPAIIDQLNGKYETLQYPLLFPHGTSGWRIGYRSTTGEKVSQREYYRCRIVGDSRLHMMGRLLNEYILDMFSRLRNSDMSYFYTDAFRMKSRRKNQIESMVREAETIYNTRDPGNSNNVTRVYLPAKYKGSYRYKKKMLDNALELYERYGPPTFFITMTCNGDWDDIKKNILPGQTWSDRPDIVCRVFQLKANDLINKINDGTIFGQKVEYYVAVIEFQKKGMPHMHLAVRLEGRQLDTHEDIDKHISAYMPDRYKDPKYHKIVKKKMYHHCYPRCFKKGKEKLHSCKYHYPQDLIAKTIVNDHGYTKYRRFKIDDKKVVANSRKLCLMYNCHINVERANRKCVGYLFKYLTKGEDRQRIRMERKRRFADPDVRVKIDEPYEFILTSYVSASEAMWNVFGSKRFFHMKMSPSVRSIFTHLENCEIVRKSSEEQTWEEASERCVSDLVRYFNRPKNDTTIDGSVVVDNPAENNFKSCFDKLKLCEYHRYFNVSKLSELPHCFKKHKEQVVTPVPVPRAPKEVRHDYDEHLPSAGASRREPFLERDDTPGFFKFVDPATMEQRREHVSHLPIYFRKHYEERSSTRNVRTTRTVNHSFEDHLPEAGENRRRPFLWKDEHPTSPRYVYRYLRGRRLCRLNMLYPFKRVGDVYYLNVLLDLFPARTFKELKTFEGLTYPTYKQACIARGLIDEANEYERCMRECMKKGHPASSLRSLFTLLMQEGGVAKHLMSNYYINPQVVARDRAKWDDAEILKKDSEPAYKVKKFDKRKEEYDKKDRIYFLYRLVEDWEELDETRRGPPLKKDDPSTISNKSKERLIAYIQKNLEIYNRNIEDHELPKLHNKIKEVEEHLNKFEPHVEKTKALEMLKLIAENSDEQFQFVRIVLEHLRNNRPLCVHLNGKPGRGKTTVVKAIGHILRATKNIACFCCTHGNGALEFDCGTTAHLIFRLPLEWDESMDEFLPLNLKWSAQREELIKRCRMIVWDEAPMTNRKLIEALDAKLRLIMENDLPFGGKIVIFTGDFEQHPPIVKNSMCPDDAIRASMKTSYVFDSNGERVKFLSSTPGGRKSEVTYSSVIFHLKKSIRVQCEKLIEFADKVGENNMPDVDDPTNKTYIRRVAFPKGTNYTDDEDDLIKKVHGDRFFADFESQRALQVNKEIVQNGILCPFLDDVNRINDKITDLYPGDDCHSVATYEFDNYEHKSRLKGSKLPFGYSPKRLSLHKENGVPPHKLRYKDGQVCFVTRNLYPQDGLMNGSKVVIHSHGDRHVWVQKAEFALEFPPRTAQNPNPTPFWRCQGKMFVIPRIRHKMDIVGGRISVYRKQLPLKLCYAMSIHKSQGKTLKKVGLYLKREVFTHGQLLVAITRCKKLDDITLCVEDKPSNFLNYDSPDNVRQVKAWNIVYNELLQHDPSQDYDTRLLPPMNPAQKTAFIEQVFDNASLGDLRHGINTETHDGEVDNDGDSSVQTNSQIVAVWFGLLFEEANAADSKLLEKIRHSRGIDSNDGQVDNDEVDGVQDPPYSDQPFEHNLSDSVYDADPEPFDQPIANSEQARFKLIFEYLDEIKQSSFSVNDALQHIEESGVFEQILTDEPVHRIELITAINKCRLLMQFNSKQSVYCLAPDSDKIHRLKCSDETLPISTDFNEDYVHELRERAHKRMVSRIHDYNYLPQFTVRGLDSELSCMMLLEDDEGVKPLCPQTYRILQLTLNHLRNRVKSGYGCVTKFLLKQVNVNLEHHNHNAFESTDILRDYIEDVNLGPLFEQYVFTKEFVSYKSFDVPYDLDNLEDKDYSDEEDDIEFFD